MTRLQLEHIIRAAGAIADDDGIVVIGSQAILGQFPDAPKELLVSREADVFPMHRRDRSDLIDGAIGEGSPFEKTFDYFAHGVGEETAILPAGWKDRLIAVSNENTRGVTGWCLEVHDLAIAKYAAGREKDFEFTAVLARETMASGPLLLERLAQTLMAEPVRELVRGRIARDFGRM